MIIVFLKYVGRSVLEAAHIVLKETVVDRADQRDQLKYDKHNDERYQENIPPPVMFIDIAGLVYRFFHPFLPHRSCNDIF